MNKLTNFEAFRIAKPELQKKYINAIRYGAGCDIVDSFRFAEYCGEYAKCDECPYEPMNCPKEWLDEEYDIDLDVFKLKGEIK